MAVALANRAGTATGLGSDTLDGRRLTDHGFLDDKQFGTDIVIVLGVGNRALEGFGDERGGLLRNESELLEGINGGKALDLTGYLTGLEGGDARVAVGGDDLHG